MFKKRKKITVGLDIGTATIKVVKLESLNQDYTLQAFAIKETPGDQTECSDLIKGTLNEIDAQNSDLSVSLSGQSVITRYVTLTSMNAVDFKNALKFEAQKYIPFPVAQVYLDGCILKENVSSNKMLALIAAAKKDFVQQRIKLIQDIGYTLDVIDMDSVALINGFKFNYSDDEILQNKTIAILNIGASISNLSILEQGVPFLSRDILLGGKSFSKKIASDLEIDFKAAEKAKTDIPKAKAEKIKSALEVVLTQLTTELRKSFDYYESQSVSSVETVYVSGGGSLLEDFPLSLNNLLGIDVKKWDPLKKIELSPSVDSQLINNQAAQLAVAIGLSMR